MHNYRLNNITGRDISGGMVQFAETGLRKEMAESTDFGHLLSPTWVHDELPNYHELSA